MIILIYYIGYVMIKKDLRIFSANSLYFSFGKISAYFEETNGNMYLRLVPTNESKKKNKNKHKKMKIKNKKVRKTVY